MNGAVATPHDLSESVIRGETDFKRAHALTESLIAALQQLIPGADCTVHSDPEGES